MTAAAEIVASQQMRDRIVDVLQNEGERRTGRAASKGRLLIAMAHVVSRLEPRPAQPLEPLAQTELSNRSVLS